MDNLTNMFRMQRTFQEELGYDFNHMSNEELVAYIKEYMLHCEHELHEVVQELPFFKPWKDYSQLAPHELREMFRKAEDEYVDVLHFFMNIGIALGFTGQTLFERFCAKHEINYDRQLEEGYKKCVEGDDEAGSIR